MNLYTLFILSFLLNNAYSQDISGISAKASNLIGTSNQGANCLNASMIALDSTFPQIFISSQTFEKWKKEDLSCKKISLTDVKSGDLISIHELDFQGTLTKEKMDKELTSFKNMGLKSPNLYLINESMDYSKFLETTIHSAIFTSHKYVFEKPSSLSKEPYRIISFEQLNTNWFRGFPQTENKEECIQKKVKNCRWLTIERCKVSNNNVLSSILKSF